MIQFKNLEDEYFMDFTKFVLSEFSPLFTALNYKWMYGSQCYKLCRKLFDKKLQPKESARIIERFKRRNK